MKTQGETVVAELPAIVLGYSTTFEIASGDLQGTTITVKANRDGFVYWCSHWEHIDLLAKAGFLNVDKGPMSHRDYYLTEQSL